MENHFSKEEIERIGNNWNKIGNLQLLNKEKNILKKEIFHIYVLNMN